MPWAKHRIRASITHARIAGSEAGRTSASSGGAGCSTLRQHNEVVKSVPGTTTTLTTDNTDGMLTSHYCFYLWLFGCDDVDCDDDDDDGHRLRPDSLAAAVAATATSALSTSC